MEPIATSMSVSAWSRHPVKLLLGLLINGAGAAVLLARVLGADG